MPDRSPFIKEPYDLTKGRDKVRAVVIITLLLALLAVIVVFLMAAWRLSGNNYAQLKEAFNIVLPVISTAFGSALGFYFGKEASK